jgi:hypothetical protein
MMLEAGRGKLYSALKTLQGQWEATEPHWRDAMRTQFTEQVLLPLEHLTTSTLQAIDQLDALFNQMQRECEGSSYDIHDDNSQ